MKLRAPPLYMNRRIAAGIMPAVASGIMPPGRKPPAAPEPLAAKMAAATGTRRFVSPTASLLAARRRLNPQPRPAALQTQRSSVLIIVLWIAFGLVSLALHFAHSMSLELRTADNQVAGAQAEQAIAGAARYLSNILATTDLPGALPDVLAYQREAVPVGDATFWLLGRSDGQGPPDLPFFSLTDEAAKLNLNTATPEMLQMLPRMTPELAAAIVDWRDSDSDVATGGAEDEIYQRLSFAYRCKNAPFESVDELRLVYGMDMLTLLGEDANLNGVLDPNEDDGDASLPEDNRDGRLDPGILEYVTVYSREATTRTNGEARVNLTGTDQQQLSALLEEKLGSERANQILQRFGVPAGGGGGSGGGGSGGGGTTGGRSTPGGGGTTGGGGATGGGMALTVRSLLEFYILSGMTAEEFAQVERDLTVSGSATEGLVNVNTASATVLACIPGIGTDLAPSLVSYRQSNPSSRTSMAWVVEVLGQTNAVLAGPYVTGASCQFAADVAALGQHGRGYQRVKFVFDTSEGAPKILYRQDLTHLGWALGKEVRQNLFLVKDKR